MSKAQITQFIAIGVILVIAVGIFLLVKDQIVTTQVVSTEFLPVAEYIKDCTEQKTEEAARLIGIQGGYVNVPDDIRFDPLSYVQQVPGMITPYWYYKGNDNSPDLSGMEEEISRYIAENVGDCLGGFEGFQEEFEIEQVGNIEATTFIMDEEIDVELQIPLNLKLVGQEQTEEINIKKSTTQILNTSFTVT